MKKAFTVIGALIILALFSYLMFIKVYTKGDPSSQVRTYGTGIELLLGKGKLES